MAAGPRERTRAIRTFSRSRSDYDEDNVHLDGNKDATENAVEILTNVCKKQGLSDVRRIALLNLLIKLLDDVRVGQLPFKITKKEIFTCLRVSMVHSSTSVRAAAHRVVRQIISEPSDVLIINKLHIPHLIARSIDLIFKSDHERIQALRLTLKLVNLAPKHFSPALVRCLVSLVNGVPETKDRMMCSALFILCKLCVLNPDALMDGAGAVCILRSCAESAQGKINECLVGCLLFLLNKPETRSKANVRIEFVTSIFCDLQREKKNEAQMLLSSKLSILAALRTWSGVMLLCNTAGTSSIKAVIQILYLNEPQLSQAIVDLFCEIFCLDGGDWSKDVDVVVRNVDPYQSHDSWRITEKFVAAEGKDILPHRYDTRPNLTELHTALLVYSFLECGLLAALVEVAIKSDLFLSTQATILLGYLLYLSHKLVPCELLDCSPSLPSLVAYSTQGDPKQIVRASTTTALLQLIHHTLTRPLEPTSLFLRRHLSQGLLLKTIGGGDGSTGNASANVQPSIAFVKNLDMHIKESSMSSYRDPRDWVWSEISIVIKCRNENFLKLEDAQYKMFLRKLVHFFKPSSSQFCTFEYSYKDKKNISYATAALDFIDLMLEFPLESDGAKMLDELMSDINRELEQMGSKHDKASTAYTNRLTSTLTQHYLVMVGHMTRNMRGLAVLERVGLLRTLYSIVETNTHDILIKIIVSSLSYHQSSMARKILSRALTSCSDSVRVYATELLLVLARCQVPMFHTWGLELLIPQVYDSNQLVANASMDILHELSYDSVILDCLIEAKPNVSYLGDKGQLLLIRFLSTPAGFQMLNESNFIERELKKWDKGYNYRYVLLLEEALHDAVTLHQREDNRKYSRRLTNAKHRWKPVWVPPHLYGQLASHAPGMALLEACPCIPRMIQTVHHGPCLTDEDILELKSSLWALANMGASGLGLKFLLERRAVDSIINVAQTCPVFSVRATAFYCLSLIATTEEGASTLAQSDWITLRRCRSARWPVEADAIRSVHRDDASSMTFSVAEADSVEDLTPFLEPPLTKKHVFAVSRRAHTLPPGLNNGDMDEVDFSQSQPMPPAETRHHRSHSETCSMLLPEHSLDSGNFSLSRPSKRLSLEDAAGLATLQNLHAMRRPDLSSNSSFPQLRRRLAEQRPSFPVNDFELDGHRSFSRLQFDGEKDTSANFSKNQPSPLYCGVCLPRNLSQIFTVSEKREERRRRGSVSFSEMEKVKEEKGESSPSSDSSGGEMIVEDPSRISSKTRHNGSHCLACCTKVPPKRQRKISTSSFRLRTDTESSYGNAPDGSPISLQWRMKVTSEGGSADSLCGETEPELRPAPVVPAVVSVARVRREVLKHSVRMCNPVWAKASLQSLLQLRQSHQSVFQDVCLYSDICRYLATTAARVTSRRVVHELFSEIPFSQFYEDADTILGAHGPLAVPAPPPPKSLPLLSDPPSSPLKTPTGLTSPTKNLSTVFEHSASCATESLQKQLFPPKDYSPKT